MILQLHWHLLFSNWFFLDLYDEGQYDEEQHDGGVYHLNIQTQCDLNAPPNFIQCAFATLMAGQSYSSSNEYNVQMNRKYFLKERKR